MTDIELVIYKKLVNLGITARIYPGDGPWQNPVYPLTVYDFIDTVPDGRSHDSNTSPFLDARLQIDVFAETVQEASSLIRQYFDTFNSFDGLLGDENSPESFVDVSIRYRNTNPRLDFKDEPTLRTIKGRSMDFGVYYK